MIAIEEFSSLRFCSSIFCRRACVYSKIFRQIPLTQVYWDRTRFRKNANNVVISSPGVFTFLGIWYFLSAFRKYGNMTPTTSALTARGRQRFFKIRFYRQPLVQYPKFFQGRVPPDGPYWCFGGYGNWVKDGARRFQVKFICRFCSNRHGSGCKICHAEFLGTGQPFNLWNLNKNLTRRFRENGFQKFWGVALFHISSLPPWGLPSPIWPGRFSS